MFLILPPATRSEVAAAESNAMYNKDLSNTKNFYVTEDCNGCGLCEKICNGRCIKVNGKPMWKDNCTKCFGCIHLCPTKAVQYEERNQTTVANGRYKNPNISINEMKVNVSLQN